MRYIFLLFLFTFSFTSFSQKQKIKVKKNIVYVDGNATFKLELNLIRGIFTVSNLFDQRLIDIRIENYYDDRTIAPGNPEGKVTYYSFTFMNEEMDKCETGNLGLKKGVAKEIVRNNLIVDNQLNEEAVKQFVRINGERFSEERNRSTTIIIQH